MKKSFIIIFISVIIFIILFFILNFFILKNTSEYYQHNMLGDTDNIVFLHPNGHEEIVVNEEGIPIVDGMNSASYNFCHPIKDPICHFTKDTYPWIKWGNSENDPTTIKQRRQAFFKDYLNGVKTLFYFR